jgi:hypothetical protein
MMSQLYSLALLFATIWVVGCAREPVRVTPKPAAPPDSDVFRRANDTFRYTENTRAGDEWTRFRSGFEQLNSHFGKVEVIKSMQELAAENRKFLETEVHLTEDELAEVESTSFRSADAHYLDECFLLRDVARVLEVAGVEPIAQANLHFHWVMRNVFLYEQIDSWIPPAFTLRRGHGSPLERAQVFLALLRQSQIDGCLIVVPETEPIQLLVAVLDPNAKTPTLHLFDPRLGSALMGKDGKSILTLKDALDEPALLQPALITPSQAKQMEAWLVCPLYAMSPRLLELQRGLSRHDAIVLHLNAAELKKEIAKATTLPIKVWNPPGQGKATPNSPTRNLRLFVPKQEGGLDETNRVARVSQARVPITNFLANYERINFTAKLLPKTAHELMLGVSADLFNKYDLQTREMYLRGLYDSMLRRHERLQSFAKDDGLIGLASNPEFRAELVAWQKQMTLANADAQHEDPKIKAKGQQAMQGLWSRDRFIGWLVELNKEEKLDRKHEKTVLTRVLAVGMREYFDFEMARAQASINQEKAEFAQALLLKNPADYARKEARDAWLVAKSSWAIYLDRIVLDSTIKQRMEQLQQVPGEQLDKRIALLETLHLEIHKYFQARLLLAECLEHLEGAETVRAEFERIKGAIEALEKKGLLHAEIKGLVTALPQLKLSPPSQAYFQTRLELLARDWSEQGHYFWMKQRIERKIGPPAKS